MSFARAMETVLLASAACLLAAVAWPIATAPLRDVPQVASIAPVPAGPPMPAPVVTDVVAPARIQVALLLDTSSSMDGLIDQARTQLWAVVNALGTATYGGRALELEIALYEYGNAGLSQDRGWIRQVQGFTTELDRVSDALFQLKTHGGDEYAGLAIMRSLDELQWRPGDRVMRVLYIAGNEAFAQGPVSTEQAMAAARRRGVTVNTIYCGPPSEGKMSGWAQAAAAGGGRFLSIDQNYVQRYVAAPQDEEIARLGERLNETYVQYGARGHIGAAMQKRQDENVARYGKDSEVKRAVSKASSLYDNSSWDLVDAVAGGKVELESVKAEALPAQLRSKDKREIREHVEAKQRERQSIKAKLAKLAKERQAWLERQQADENEAATLDNALIDSMKAQAKAAGFVVE